MVVLAILTREILFVGPEDPFCVLIPPIFPDLPMPYLLVPVVPSVVILCFIRVGLKVLLN